MQRYRQNDRKTGSYYETVAAGFLEKQGIRILSRNYRIRLGEIDVIALDRDCICFIEVKYRSTLAFGRPAEAVNEKKQRTIRRVAEFWCVSHKCCDRPARFDIIEIIGNDIRYLKNAF